MLYALFYPSCAQRFNGSGWVALENSQQGPSGASGAGTMLFPILKGPLRDAQQRGKLALRDVGGLAEAAHIGVRYSGFNDAGKRIPLHMCSHLFNALQQASEILFIHLSSLLQSIGRVALPGRFWHRQTPDKPGQQRRASNKSRATGQSPSQLPQSARAGNQRANPRTFDEKILQRPQIFIGPMPPAKFEKRRKFDEYHFEPRIYAPSVQRKQVDKGKRGASLVARRSTDG
jgi:hypothetical protein